MWKLDDGSYLMDNIYVMKDSDQKIFLEYAKHRGWHAINNDYNKTFVAHIKPMTFDKYPSVDNITIGTRLLVKLAIGIFLDLNILSGPKMMIIKMMMTMIIKI